VPPPDPKGAYDYLLKPVDLLKLDRVLGEALKVSRLMREPAVVVGTPPDDHQPGEAIVVSYVTAVSLACRVGRVERFPRAPSLANYWGLTPGCRNSG
jgi:hypothetical protein